jgi:hypothetical protein
MAINTAPDNPEQLEAIDLAIKFFVSHLSTRFSYATLRSHLGQEASWSRSQFGGSCFLYN